MSASGGLRALAVVLPLVGLAACASTSSLVAQKEDHLAAAGFVVRPANTPQRQAMLNRLPPHHFVRREHGDAIHYVYADPLVCDCLYVGDQSAYQRYQAYVQAQNLADEQEMTAQTYQDQQWNWDNWGPWGPGFGPMGFGPGPFGPGW
ncbi:hypothetical protein KGY14_05790 [Ameyamaea chiangmaiensis]|uniref:Lipoprotein n=1 Tax=Ameyamaea chiangmaiensis TaxID=442969 RepID=A0A850PAR6_9PROT|nr:hypothetical protein [Ameyamaea chiangmaiensis]NVN41617.1 hypothetical protein [Ameyamaea chiangmaiensis]